MKKLGKFIVVEGMDGSGKSSVTNYVHSYFQERSIPTIKTFEIGGTPIGKQIRTMFLNSADEKIDPRARMLAFLAARIQHLVNVVNPAIADGKVVVSDRYSPSTLVYQGYNDGILGCYRDLLPSFSGLGLDVTPDFIIYLKTSAEIAYERGVARCNVDNTTYKTTLTQAYQTAHAYEEVMTCFYADTCVLTIDADHDFETVQKQVKDVLDWIVTQL